MNNTEVFHAADGSGYDFFTDQILDMDSRNPSVAARLAGAFEIKTRLDTARQNQIAERLKTILAAKPSENLAEITGKILEA